jgi:hypothetical protein
MVKTGIYNFNKFLTGMTNDPSYIPFEGEQSGIGEDFWFHNDEDNTAHINIDNGFMIWDIDGISQDYEGDCSVVLK